MHLAAAPHRTRGREHRIYRRAARFSHASHASRIAHPPGGPAPLPTAVPGSPSGRGRPARGTMTPARVAFGEKWVGRGKTTLCIRMVSADATSGSTAWKIPAPVVFSVL